MVLNHLRACATRQDRHTATQHDAEQGQQQGKAFPANLGATTACSLVWESMAKHQENRPIPLLLSAAASAASAPFSAAPVWQRSPPEGTCLHSAPAQQLPEGFLARGGKELPQSWGCCCPGAPRPLGGGWQGKPGSLPAARSGEDWDFTSRRNLSCSAARGATPGPQGIAFHAGRLWN